MSRLMNFLNYTLTITIDFRTHNSRSSPVIAIAYTILYQNVFQIPNVAEIVTTMLHDKPSSMISNSNYFPKELTESTSCDDALEDDDAHVGKKEEKKELQLNEYDLMMRTNITPFPFKVAKALDPNIYRNIAYDTWTETRKRKDVWNDTNLLCFSNFLQS